MYFQTVAVQPFLINMIYVLTVGTGVKVMFRVALVLFKFTLGRPEQLAECPTLYETMDRIRHIPQEYMQEEFLSREVDALYIECVEKLVLKKYYYISEALVFSVIFFH